VFGEDLEKTPFMRLARYRFDASKNGWHVLTDEHLDLGDPHEVPEPWEPVFLTQAQHFFVMRLCEQSPAKVANPADEGLTEADITFLQESGLVGRTIADPQCYEMLTTDCLCGFLPDGRAFAGENNNGQTQRWTRDFVDKWRRR
jgi:hypothetical protein